MVPSPPFLPQTYHTLEFDYADKEKFECSWRYSTLERLKGLCVKEMTSCFASYTEGKTGGI